MKAPTKPVQTVRLEVTVDVHTDPILDMDDIRHLIGVVRRAVESEAHPGDVVTVEEAP